MPNMEMTVKLEILWPDDKRTEIMIEIDWLMGIIVTLKVLKDTKKIKGFMISG